MICSVCNAVKYVDSLNDYDCPDYKQCNDEHDLIDGNMMAVASYENKDYYKCKYCRYVAPFENNVTQNWTITSSAINHTVTNEVTGLTYSFTESHSWDENYKCTECGHQHVHAYTDKPIYQNYAIHAKVCACGHQTEQGNHYVTYEDAHDGDNKLTCIGCGARLLTTSDTIIIEATIVWVTANGSYISSEGIAVLVDEDIEAYENGTLVFYNINDGPIVSE